MIFLRQLRDWDCRWVSKHSKHPNFESSIIKEINARQNNCIPILKKIRKWITKKIAIAAVRAQPNSIQAIPPHLQSKAVIMEAVRGNPRTLRYAKHQSAAIAMEAVSKDAFALEFVHPKYHSHAIVGVAARRDPISLKYTKIQPESVAIEAVKQNPENLRYIYRQTERIIIEAIRATPVDKDAPLAHAKFQSVKIAKESIKINPDNLSLIRKKFQTESVILAALKNKPQLLWAAKKQTARIVRAAVLRDPTTLKFTKKKYQSTAFAIRAVNKDPGLLKFIAREFQTESVVLKAVQANPMLLKFAKFQNEKIARAAIAGDIYALDYVLPSIKTEKFLISIAKTASYALWHIDPSEQTPKIVNAAIRCNPNAIKRVRGDLQTEATTLYAISKQPLNLRFVKNKTPLICQAASKINLWAFSWIKKTQQPTILSNLLEQKPARKRAVANITSAAISLGMLSETPIIDRAWPILLNISRRTADFMPDIKIIADPQKAPVHHFPLSQDENINDPIPLLDVLGEYYGAEYLVVIYKGLIDKYSKQNNINPLDLFIIVFIHELAHAINHMGKGQDGTIWTNFPLAPSGAKEMFAQWYTYKTLRQLPNASRLLTLMEWLTNRQPKIYQTYRYFTRTSAPTMSDQVEIAKSNPQHCPELLCNYCFSEVAVTSVKRWDTFIMKTWQVPTCKACESSNQQTWFT